VLDKERAGGRFVFVPWLDVVSLSGGLQWSQLSGELARRRIEQIQKRAARRKVSKSVVKRCMDVEVEVGGGLPSRPRSIRCFSCQHGETL
jgi:hypothetical protein